MIGDSPVERMKLTRLKELCKTQRNFWNTWKESPKGRQLVKWVSFCIGVCVMISSGTIYVFSVYSPSFVEKLGYSGKQIACIVSIGSYASSFSGIFFGNYLDNYSTRLISSIASLFGFLGYFFMALTYNDQLMSSSFLLMGFFYLLVGLSSSAANFSALTTNIRNSDMKHRGLVVGILSSASGLSALIFTQLDTLLFVHRETKEIGGSNTYSFLIFMALSLGCINFMAIFLLHKVRTDYMTLAPVHQPNEEKSMEPPPIQDRLSLPSSEKLGILHPVMTFSGELKRSSIAITSRVAHPMIESTSPSDTMTTKDIYYIDDRDSSSPNPNPDPISIVSPIEPHTPKTIPPTTTSELHGPHTSFRESHIPFREVLSSIEFWLFFSTIFLSVGVAYLFINNLGTIVVALSTSDDKVLVQKQINKQVSLFSLLNCLGRLLFGFLSDFLLRHFFIDRSWLLLSALLGMTIMQLVAFFTKSLDMLTWVTILLAFSYGCLYSLSPTIISEQFGESDFGRNWGMLTCGAAFGASLSNLVFGAVYDHHRLQDQPTCRGHHCFQLSFLYGLVSCCLTICTTLLLIMRRRHRHLYQ